MTIQLCARAKYYRCRIFESDVLVHDYVPCVKGGDVERIPDDGYIEATGIKQYIDTGYKAKSSTCVVADFAFTTNVSNPTISQPWILGHV